MNIQDRVGKRLTCRICGSDSLKALGTVRGKRTGESISTAKCRRCGHYSIYPTAYGPLKSFDWDGIPFYVEAMASSRRHSLITISRLMKILRRAPEETRFLDVGCGLGFALLSAQELGLTAVGLDPEVKISEYGRANFGVNIVTDKFENHPFVGQRFDLIYMEQVLEHIESPRRFLELATELLSPDGIIYVGVPPVNFVNRVTTRLRIRRLRISRLSNPLFDIFFDPEEHLNGFTGKSMACLASLVGLESICLNRKEFLTGQSPSLTPRERVKYFLRSVVGSCGMGQFVLRRNRSSRPEPGREAAK
jgi:SAM-dependent methyltransferase